MTYKPRTPFRRLVGLCTSLALVLSVLVAIPIAEAQDGTLIVRRGSIGDGQSINALAVQDQVGTQDDWSNYIEFMPEGRNHVSLISLPVAGTGDDLTLSLNFRGSDWQTMRWAMDLYDYDADKWERVYRSIDAESWVWSSFETTLDSGSRFVNQGYARARYRSSNNADVSQLDLLTFTLSGDTPPPGDVVPPPINADVDYQIGGAYPLPAGVNIVSRDWFHSRPAARGYSICYVNAFQTQPDSPDVNRIDETSNWPSSLVLTDLADDPGWTGEYLIDISTAGKRTRAAAWVARMIDRCATKGYDAVEFDNLDSWTRFEDVPSVDALVPFGQPEAVAFATIITQYAQSQGLAVAQKNTTSIIQNGDYQQIGFDFAIAESCAVYNECSVFTNAYDAVIMIEYSANSFTNACRDYGDEHSIVRRDRNVRRAGVAGYIFATC